MARDRLEGCDRQERHEAKQSEVKSSEGSDTISAMNFTNLACGLLGSVAAALATFAAAAFTLWRTRVGDARREGIRLAEREQARREEMVGQIVGSLQMLESEVRWAPLRQGRTLRYFLEAAMTFYASQHQAHPEVADWLVAQCNPFQSVMLRWQRTWMIPIINRRHLAAVGTLTGELNAAIVAWAAGEIPDATFKDPDRSPSEIAVAAQTGRVATARSQTRS
jgi:hypothetical protein